jgi:hypothetical protein
VSCTVEPATTALAPVSRRLTPVRSARPSRLSVFLHLLLVCARDYTTGQIISLNLAGQDAQVVAVNVAPVGLFASPVGLVYLDFAAGVVSSLDVAGGIVVAPPPVQTAAYIHAVPQQQTWVPGQAQLAFAADSNIGGECPREGWEQSC